MRRDENILTLIFVAAIATLGVMNGNVRAADEQKAEAEVAAEAVVASTEEPPKAEHPKSEHLKSEKHDHEAEHTK